MTTPEENIKYWLDVIVNPNHSHRKKFSKKFNEAEIEAYCNRMIALNEKDINKEVKLNGSIAA